MSEETEESLIAVRTLKEVYDYLESTAARPTVEIDHGATWYEVTDLRPVDEHQFTVELFPRWEYADWDDAIRYDLDAHKFRRVRFS